jgi:predicted helicase
MADYREVLGGIRTFPSLIKFLRDELDWPISSEDFEELTFDYTPEELGIDIANAAKIQEIKRLRPLSTNQPWGIFFVKFEPKKLPVVALRRILSRVVVKKRASANSAERTAWEMDDLLFVSNYGEDEERRISLAHFAQDEQKNNLPTLKVLGWDNLDTPLHLNHVADVLSECLAWPEDEENVESWRESWCSAFTLQHREVITTSKDLAVRLAELARAIRNRIKTVLDIETEDGSITKLMTAFTEALVHDLDQDSFADMYAQTIAYGLLSARIANPAGGTADDFAAQMPVTNPFLKELMETFVAAGGRKGKAGSGLGIDFDELGVSEVVELLNNANMEAVVRDFGDRNPQEDPVIHFYELFLKEYDAKKRMQRGVFYTPLPVVSYIVRSVDELLRIEFGLADGLADTTTWGEIAGRLKHLKIPEGVSPDQDFVQILDPATGTGTFLVEVIDIIHKTLVSKWNALGHGGKKIEALWNEYVSKHLLPRLHGYELLMAPYAIAHLKIGLKLYETGYRFGSNERARIYLTNALEPASDIGQQEYVGILPALAHEAQAVNEIKRKLRFTVVIGNPPYSSDSQNRGAFAANLVSQYKHELKERKINLDDDYIKFIALAELLISSAGNGSLGIVTNNTYIDGLTLRAMRRELLNTFNQICVVDLHGSPAKRQRAADGSPDENVFEIEQGVCISLMSRQPIQEAPTIEYAEVRGRRQYKYDILSGEPTIPMAAIDPRAPDYFLVPKNLERGDEWLAWPSLAEAMNNKSGFMSQRDGFVIDENASILSRRIKSYFSSTLEGDALAAEFGIHDYRNFSVADYKREHQFEPNSIVRCLFRPFDFRYIYYKPTIVQQASTDIMQHFLQPNTGLVFMRQVVQEEGGYNHFFVTRVPVDHRSMRSNRGYANVAPLFFYEDRDGFLEGNSRHANLSAQFLGDLRAAIGTEVRNFDEILAFIYATFYSNSYRQRYAEFLKIDFPRIPLPDSLDLFHDLVLIGSELVALHLMESPKLDDFITTYTSVEKRKVGRVGWANGTVWLDAEKTTAHDGHRATKPGTIGFHGVPEGVWDFHIGGYQVCYKWLRDRKGCTLSDDDISHYQKIIVALNETIRIMGEIDNVIKEHGDWPEAFVT